MRRLLHLVVALLLGGLSLELCGLASRLALFGPLLLAGASFVWFVWALLFLAPRGSWLEKRRKDLALAIASTVVVLAVAVVASGIIGMGPSEQFFRAHLNLKSGISAQKADPTLGWAPMGPPDIVGQRLERVDPSKPQVVVAGDSIVYGLNLDDKDLATSIMSLRRGDYQFLNAAVSGYSIEQYWLYLQRVLPHTNPKLIIVGLFTGNDVQLTGREFTPWGRGKPLYRLEGDRLVRAGHAANCADGLAGSLLFRGLWHDPRRAEGLVRLLCNPVILGRGVLEATIARLFDEIEALGRERGVPVVFALLPTRDEFSLYAEDRAKYVAKYWLLKQLLENGHHETLDFHEELVRTKVDQALVYQRDNSHFTVLGQELLADYLLRSIDERHLLP